MKPLTRGFTEKLQYINQQGELTQHFPASVSNADLVSFYKTLVMIRLFDKKAVALQRTGQIGTYASCLGQEAISTGIGFAMSDNDVLCNYYRDHGAQYVRGVKLHQMLQYWGGDERGNDFGGAASQDLPNAVPIATQITHGAGIASAFKIRGEKRAALATIGDGGTSRGDFYEAMNLAGVWQLPLVLVVNNNHWAISVPSDLQTGSQNIAIKAQAAGIEGILVDGNDIVAVHTAVSHALKKARMGKGATLIEAESYRLCDHTTADDATRYREANEVNQAWEAEPIKRLQTYLHKQNLWSPEQEQLWIKHCQQEIELEVQEYLAIPPQQANELFDFLYEELPYQYQRQRDHLIAKAAGGMHHGH
ncbi:MAG: pyruvate dehydrogenase (acetyl-transferring) E1 component subunit alpha [Pseudomonadales bacterium]|nr:pyruvate dehydrogenase (acetyl-transferring) E1 component subunit alpha [Pseudomonadales bacterium]